LVGRNVHRRLLLLLDAHHNLFQGPMVRDSVHSEAMLYAATYTNAGSPHTHANTDPSHPDADTDSSHSHTNTDSAPANSYTDTYVDSYTHPYTDSYRHSHSNTDGYFYA
jgi:hypothetical protein